MADRSTLPAQPTIFHDPPECTARGCLAGDRRNLCDYDARAALAAPTKEET